MQWCHAHWQDDDVRCVVHEQDRPELEHCPEPLQVVICLEDDKAVGIQCEFVQVRYPFRNDSGMCLLDADFIEEDQRRLAPAFGDQARDVHPKEARLH